MSEVESKILDTPINEQTRLALIYIAKMLERIDKRLETLCAILEDMMFDNNWMLKR